MAASSLFASALGNAISQWMEKEGETAEKLPALRQSALDLALNKAKAPGELRLQQQQIRHGDQAYNIAGSAEKRAAAEEERRAQLHPYKIGEEIIKAKKDVQDYDRGAQALRENEIKIKQAETSLDQSLMTLSQDKNFQAAVAKMAQGQDMSKPEVAIPIGIKAAYATGKFSEGLEMMKLYQTLQHYKALEAGAAATSKYREDSLAERRKAREALEAYRNRMATAKEKPPLKPTDYARIMQKAQAQAYREENKMMGDPLTPQERERIEARTNELYNKAVTAGSEEKATDPVEEALKNLAESLSDDVEATTESMD